MNTDFISTLVDTLFGKVDWLYVVSIILINYLLLSYIITKPNKWWKIGIHLSLGLILGEVWHLVESTSFVTLIYSFPFSILLYNWVLKNLMERFKISYDNGQGII